MSNLMDAKMTLRQSFVRGWFFVFAMVMGFSPETDAETGAVEVVVSLKDAKALTIRSAPNAESTVVAFIENGKAIVKKGQEDANGFVMVQLGDGRTGWTKASFLTRPQPATPAQIVPDVVNTVPVVQPVAVAVSQQPVLLATTEPAIRTEVPPVPAIEPSRNVQKAPVTSVPHPVAQSEQVAEKLPGTQPEISVVHVLIAGFVGLLIGFIIGGKSGMAYASRSIHDRYEVIG